MTILLVYAALVVIGTVAFFAAGALIGLARGAWHLLRGHAAA